MDTGYTQRDDRRFGLRFMAVAVLASVPVWGGLLGAFWLRCSLVGYLAVLAFTLPIPLAVLGLAFRWTKCPSCGEKIRVPWRSREYRSGGVLRYRCDHCRVVWTTHLYPGSDV